MTIQMRLSQLRRHNHFYVTRAIRIICMFSMLSMSACSDFGSQGRRWTEDVQLDDSRIIRIEREVQFKESNAMGGGAYNAVETSSIIKFTGELAELPPWKDSLRALVLYFDTSNTEWVVVATTTSCEVWFARGKPRPMYWEYRLRGERWQETPLASTSIGRETNLFHLYEKPLEKKHITVEERSRLQSNPRIAREYRSIISDKENNCMGSP